MKKINRFLVVALLLPHLTACGGAATRSASPGRGAEPAPVSTVSAEKAREDAPEPSGPEEEGSGASSQDRSPAPEESPRASTASSEASENEMAIDISMEPSCVRRTEKTTMTVKTEKFADISYGLSYSDSENHEQYGLGRTDAKGSYVKTFVIPLDAAAGEVKVLVVGLNAANHHGGSSEATFRVASTSC